MSALKKFMFWKKIASPNTKIYFWQLVTNVVPVVLEIMMAIFFAKLLDSVSVFDFAKSKTYILYLLIFLSTILLFNNINHVLYKLQTKTISNSVYDKIFTKFSSNFHSKLNSTSKEKIINIIASNADTITKFTNLSCKEIAALVALIVMNAYIFYYNYIVGLISLGIVTVSCLQNIVVSGILSRQLGKTQRAKDSLFECVGGIIDGIDMLRDNNIVSSVKNKFNGAVGELIKNDNKEESLKMIYERWILFVAQALIYLTVFYLVGLLENYSISYATFLVLVPYLSSSVFSTLTFISIFQDLGRVNVSALRINTILEMSSPDIVAFGNNTTNNIDGCIVFSNVSFVHKKPEQNNYGQLKKISFFIPKNTLTTLTGQNFCGKETIFHLLCRDIRPTSGTITFDTISIYDFDNKTYAHNFSHLLAVPHFFNDTIFNNLKFVCKHTRQIYRVLKTLDILSLIKDLPNAMQTKIGSGSNVPPFLLFLLGFARCLLTNSEIIAIYELPQFLSKNELDKIKKTIKQASHHHTILYFATEPKLNDISHQIISIDSGKISKKTT